MATAFGSEPVVVPGATPTFAVILNNGDIEIFTNSGTTLASWTTQDLTTLAAAPTVSGTLALGASATLR